MLENFIDFLKALMHLISKISEVVFYVASESELRVGPARYGFEIFDFI